MFDLWCNAGAWTFSNFQSGHRSMSQLVNRFYLVIVGNLTNINSSTAGPVC